MFFHCLGGGYFLDDETIYLEDPHILNGTVASAFGRDLPKFVPTAQGYRYYRPLAILTHIVLARLFANQPFALHLVSVAAHTAAGILVFLLLRQFVEWTAAWFAAALFLVHPVHVEAVAWMAAVPEVAAACLILLSLWTMVRSRNGPAWLAVASYVAAAAALLTKETALALPLLAAVVLAWRGERPWRAWPYFAITAGSLVLRILTVGFFSTPPAAPTLRENLAVVASAAVHHTRKLVWPWPLSFEYELWQTATAWIAAACIWALALWLAWRNRQARYALLLCAAAISPALAFSTILHVFPFHQVQDRHAYLAVLGPALLVALIINRPTGRALAGVLLVVWSVLSVVSIHYWRDAESVWRHTLQITPASKNAVLGLGDWYYSTGRFDDAERVYQYGLGFRPDDREILLSRAANRKNLRLPRPDEKPPRHP